MNQNKHAPTLFLLLTILVGVRILALTLFGSGASSQDMGYWLEVAKALDHQKNPYVETPYLNWPPFWMLCVWGFDQIAQFLSIDLRVVIKLGLIGVDAVLLLATYSAIRFSSKSPSYWKLLMLPLALNPFAILLTTVHGNFDVFVALWVLLCVHFSLRFKTSGDAVDRLWAAVFLGLGILTKTVPFVLFPLLFANAKDRSRSESILVSVLAICPSLIGMGILYVLSPHEINERVIGYRGVPGWFGISGFLDSVGLEVVSRKIYPGLFFLGLLSFLVITMKKFTEQVETRSEELLAAAIFALLAVPTLGPGFGLQYAYWTLPLMILSMAVLKPPFHRAVITHLILLSLTYCLLYATSPSLGAFASHMGPVLGLRIEPIVYSKLQSTVITTPIFLSAVWILLECAKVLCWKKATSV